MSLSEVSLASLADYDLGSHSASTLSIFYLNARSLRTSDKFTCLKYKIKQAGFPDVISITETWLSDGEDVYFHLEGYNLFSVNRPHRVGGGILLKK